MDDETKEVDAKEKQEAEQTVDPQTNATFTKLTPGPDAGEATNVTLPDGSTIPNINRP